MLTRLSPRGLRAAGFAGFSGLVGAFVLAAVGCTAPDKQVIDNAAEKHRTIEVAVVQQPEVEEYINQVGDRLKDAARELYESGQFNKGLAAGDKSWMFTDRLKFVLVNSQKVNAVSTGGETIYIFNGFLQEAQSEEELAAIMAHEFGHVYGRHVNNQMAGDQWRGGLWQGIQQSFADEPDPVKRQQQEAGAKVLFDAGANAAHLGFSNKDEAEADEIGFTVYCKAGYDPDRFGDLFKNRLAKGGDAEYKQWESMHPSLAKRLDNTSRTRQRLVKQGIVGEPQEPVVPQFRFDELKELAAAEAARTRDDSPEFAAAREALNAFPSCFEEKEDKPQAQTQPQAQPRPQPPANPPPAAPRPNPLEKLFGR